MSLARLAKLIAKANEEKRPEQDFLHMLEEATSRLAEQRQPSKSYKPSSLGTCMRLNYFQVTGAPIDTAAPQSASLAGINQSGSARHEAVQETISKMKQLGYDCEWIDVEQYLKRRPQVGTKVVSKKGHETKVFNSVLNMSFMCDGIIKLRGVYYIFEFKTETSFKYQVRNAPEPKHVVQAAAYGLGLGVDRVMFVYENRDVCAKKAYVIELTEQDKVDKVIHYIETCNSHIERGIVPPKTDNPKDCKYCQWQQECKKY
jgi:CRISPR/Cas system-associated exonuclease Cas4 (RecB family)